jgi:hypothetical protein
LDKTGWYKAETCSDGGPRLFKSLKVPAKWSTYKGFAGGTFLLFFGTFLGFLQGGANLGWKIPITVVLLLAVCGWFVFDRKIKASPSQAVIVEFLPRGGEQNSRPQSGLEKATTQLRTSFLHVSSRTLDADSTPEALLRTAAYADALVDYATDNEGRPGSDPSLLFIGRLTSVFAAATKRRYEKGTGLNEPDLLWLTATSGVVTVAKLTAIAGSMVPAAEAGQIEVIEESLDAHAADLAVVVAISKNTLSLSRPHLENETEGMARLTLKRTGPIAVDELAGIAELAAKAMSTATDECAGATIHLFFDCPDAVAAYLGLRLGRLVEGRDVVLHEWDFRAKRYIAWPLPNDTWRVA